MHQVNDRLKVMSELKNNLNSVTIAVNFCMHQVQPLMAWVHLGFEYDGDKDTTWERSKIATSEQELRRMADFFASNVDIPRNCQGCAKPFTLGKPPS
uniref:Uncharacterized protein n=1 Tax=Arundo donax TaxID=35708 RepID=A0A0A8ZI60_ARUDO